VRAYLWTMLALYGFSFVTNLWQLFDAKPKVRSAEDQMQASAIGLAMAVGFGAWVWNLL
jgi:hypothetical protein